MMSSTSTSSILATGSWQKRAVLDVMPILPRKWDAVAGHLLRKLAKTGTSFDRKLEQSTQTGTCLDKTGTRSTKSRTARPRQVPVPAKIVLLLGELGIGLLTRVQLWARLVPVSAKSVRLGWTHVPVRSAVEADCQNE